MYLNVLIYQGKNYLINSVIEEERSENFTDSEYSAKKKSFFLSKNFLSPESNNVQEKKEEFDTNPFFLNRAVINLDKEVFRNSKKSPRDKVKSDILITNDIKMNNFLKQNYGSHTKNAKSEIFNIKIDLKANFELLNKKVSFQEELHKNNLIDKKKLLLKSFYHNQCNLYYLT